MKKQKALTDSDFQARNLDILIIQTAFIGDMILTTPLISAIKKQFIHSHIDVLAIPSTRLILHNNPDVRTVHVYDKRNSDKGPAGFLRICRLIHQARYQIVFSPHRSMKSALIAWFSGAPYRISFKNSAGAFLYNFVVPDNRSLHEIERILTLLQVSGCDPESTMPRVYPSESDRKMIDALCATSLKAVALAPGSVWATKRWPPKYFRQLAMALAEAGMSVFLIGGESDKSLCQEICTGTHKKIINVAGQLNLLQSAALLQKCSVLVTNDSAPMHLASATATPVVAIYGPTVQSFGFYPYHVKFKIIERDLPCRPCSKHGGRRCPIKTHECMEKITPQEVLKDVIKLLKDSVKSNG
jgi:heptosyltransferase II